MRDSTAANLWPQRRGELDYWDDKDSNRLKKEDKAWLYHLR